MDLLPSPFFFFFFNDPAPTEIYPLSLPDPLPICASVAAAYDHYVLVLRAYLALDRRWRDRRLGAELPCHPAVSLIEVVHREVHAVELAAGDRQVRSEEHTSELQSQSNLVCRLLLG